MVYSFFEPDRSDQSLGTYIILDHILRARRKDCLMSISATGSQGRAR